jgi:hypothetical protein
VDGQSRWVDAKQFCEAEGGRLAHIANQVSGLQV